jgi:hypothetical protein
LQAVGLSDAHLRQLQPVCTRLGESLAMQLELDSRQGDLVLAESSFVRSTPPQALAHIVDARPLLTCDLTAPADRVLSPMVLFERRQHELLQQLRDLPLVRKSSPEFGPSGWRVALSESSTGPSGFDGASTSREAPAMSVDQQRLVTCLLRGLIDASSPPLVLSYGQNALMRIDFQQAYALIDPLAQQALRVRREQPELVHQGTPGADAIARDVDELVWDLGIAFGPLRLLDQPSDWWHTPLSTCADPSVQRFTRLPRHLDLAAVLFSARVTPAELQQRTGHSAAEMRPFLQACLFLGMVWWSPDI